MTKTLFLALLALSSLPAHAGDKVLNGGDACERRFKEVRADLSSWIEKGGHEGLALPAGLTRAEYRAGMLREISRAKISCTDDRLYLGKTEKTCLNSIDENGKALIRCQNERFLRLSQDDQYRLTHHEYAGLAGFEANRDEESRYELSNQIAAYLGSLTVKRLTVKTGGGADELINRNFADFFGDYQVLACSLTANIALDPNGEPNLCKLKKIKLTAGESSTKNASVMMFFIEKDPDLYGFGTVLAWSECQVGYGMSHCSPAFNTGSKRFITTRIEKLGESYHLDFANEDENKQFLKWSLVLRRL